MRCSVTQPDQRFKDDPAYQYITEADEIPTYPEINQDDPIARVRLFLTNSRFAYYVTALTEYGDTPVLTGFCVSPLGPDCDEEGDVAVEELIELRDPLFQLPVERDHSWTPRPLSEIRKELTND